MKWNQKGILVCVLLFAAVLGVMIVQTVGNGTKKEEPTYASEEDMAIVPESTNEITNSVSGEAVTPSSPPSTKKPSKKKEEREQKKEEVQATTVPSPTAKSVPKQKSSGKTKKESKKEKQAETTAAPTRIPSAAPSTPKPQGNTVDFEIQCKAILNKQSLWKEGIEEIIPKSGVFFSGQCTFSEGETAYDVLKRICKEQGIALDSVYTPLYGTYYVKGIGNLYEFDCGSESGWLYSVNGVTLGIGSSGYKVKNQDKIVFYYDYEY